MRACPPSPFQAQPAAPRRRRALGWGILLILAAVLPAAVEAGKPHFFFVQITDTHWGARDGITTTRKIVDAIKASPMPIEFVVHTGDILADNIDRKETVDKGLGIMAELRVPVHYVAGNHDLPTNKTTAVTLYKKRFGPLATTAEYHGVLFLFVCMEPLTGKIAIPDYDPLKWVAAQLREAKGRPVVLCQHSPPTTDYYDGELHEGWPMEMRTRWEALLDHSPIVAVLTGHFHRDELHWIRDVPVYVCEPAVRFWERQPAFRIYEYEDGKLSYRTQYIEEPPRAKRSKQE